MKHSELIRLKVPVVQEVEFYCDEYQSTELAIKADRLATNKPYSVEWDREKYWVVRDEDTVTVTRRGVNLKDPVTVDSKLYIRWMELDHLKVYRYNFNGRNVCVYLDDLDPNEINIREEMII